MALWDGRFEKGMDELVKEFNASIGFDQRMYNEDIDGSIAHVKMLAGCGIVPEEERDKIIAGLNRIREKIESGEITFTVEDEDIHMGIESRLIEEIGDTGKKLHTARSRNDQVQVDLRLYTRKQICAMIVELIGLEEVILRKAEQYKDKITVGFTHIQHAQPITIGFWFMAYFQMFRRDIERLMDCYERMNLSPLGSCAMAGTTFPTDRHMTAEELGFFGPTENAMDSVSDRDYIIEFLSAAAISMMHVSRWSEEFVWWNSSEFAFLDIDDSFCTGSSIMPQKKNPDIAELLRGKSGRVYGDLMGMLTVMKGTPMAYNKDYQEDKEGLYDAADTWRASIRILAKMLDKTEFRMDKINEQLSRGFLSATDVAEHLAKQGIPFREAHNIVGRMVKAAEVKGCQLEELDEAALKEVDA
ncbi:MAG: argininosuccinate lyase, partial [Firmicutes bacterium]|nr:argininosuccinate lyase [Bacillota bacterium]